MNEVMADQKYGVPIVPQTHFIQPNDEPSTPQPSPPSASEMLLYALAAQAQLRRDMFLARLHHQFWPRCLAHPKPNAYKCKCTFVRMIHWEHSKCPRCGLTRPQSQKWLADKAAAEAAAIAKERAKYFG